jgi:NTE family protein
MSGAGSNTALVLAGAVAKGAFEAGVIQELAARSMEFPIKRIVGASSGAINAAVYATAVRAGQEVTVAERLAELWQHNATWHNALHLDFSAIMHLMGIGRGDRILELMQHTVADLQVERSAPVDLRMVVTALNGERGKHGDPSGTTFEHVLEFADDAFDSKQSREEIFRAALASGAFPGVFAPVDIPGVGPCVDGGAVNNAPIKQAISGGGIDRIFVVTAQPLAMRAPKHLAGMDLVSHFAEILIDERLYQDLRFAAAVNDYLAKFDAMVALGAAPEVIAEVKRILGWSPLEVIQIRPDGPLPGGAFSGFSNPELMTDYVAAGREAAVKALRSLTGA